MSTTTDETKFSIFKSFNNFDYADTLFRNQPEGMRLEASYEFSKSDGEKVIRTGYYTLEDRNWVLKRGYDVVGLFWVGGNEARLPEQNGQYYADECAFSFTEPIHFGDGDLETNEFMDIKFIPAPQAKKGGAPF